MLQWKSLKGVINDHNKLVGFAIPAGTQNENARKRKDRKILKCCQIAQKAEKYESDGDINRRWCTRNDLQNGQKEL